VNLLCGDFRKARERLGWEPATRMDALARLMTDADVEALSAPPNKVP
jgi:GDPmannose 4,6-dehydratase